MGENNTELLHDTHIIKVFPHFDNLAPRETGNAYSPSSHHLTRGRYAKPLLCLSASAAHPIYHLVPIGKQLVNRQIEVKSGSVNVINRTVVTAIFPFILLSFLYVISAA